MHNTQERDYIDVTGYDNLMNMMTHCSKNLKDDEVELITMRQIPCVIRFKFKCNKQKMWAVLNY